MFDAEHNRHICYSLKRFCHDFKMKFWVGAHFPRGFQGFPWFLKKKRTPNRCHFELFLHQLHRNLEDSKMQLEFHAWRDVKHRMQPTLLQCLLNGTWYEHFSKFRNNCYPKNHWTLPWMGFDSLFGEDSGISKPLVLRYHDSYGRYVMVQTLPWLKW